MLRNPQSTERITKAKSVQFSNSARTTNSPINPPMSFDKSDIGSSNSLTSTFMLESNFDKEVEKLLQEFDERCAKLWQEEDKLFRQALETTQIKPLPSPLAPKIELRPPKPKTVCVKTTTNSSDKKGTFRSELHLKEFPQKKKAPRFIGVLKQEKTISSDKFEIDIDVAGFELSELSVRTEGDRILIHAKTEKSNGNPGRMLRQLKRDYQLPNDVDPYDVTAVLISRDQLRIAAPMKCKQ